ncbi:MAG: prephenate dehydratase [Acidobacteriota bacterium]|nr:prephenate dehydratase [Acidobacteriota bacterium]
MRVGYLGPRGTFSEQALLGAVRAGSVAPVAFDGVHAAIMAVADGEVPVALVPIENSIEGPVTVTLDTLAGDAAHVRIAGELVLGVQHCLIASRAVALGEISEVLTHPQAAAQCAGFLRRELPSARVSAASSTADAVRTVAEHGGGRLAAIGTRLAAELYGCVVLREGVEDRPDNETRFVWLTRAGEAIGLPLRDEDHKRPASGTGKTSLVFWGPGADHAGWLVRCLDEFARREINLTKIESRPRRERLGHYMFFADLEGSADDPATAAALDGLRDLCEEVRVLGSYPTAG